jgi:hypothetical protein
VGLTEQHGIAGSHNHDSSIHVHAAGTTHRHHDSGAASEHSDGDGKSPAGNCCGLFCMTALAGEGALRSTKGMPATPLTGTFTPSSSRQAKSAARYGGVWGQTSVDLGVMPWM